MLEKGALIGARDNEGATPLHIAAEWGRKSTAELLIGEGADLKAENNNGKTPVELASTMNHKVVAELLAWYANQK